MKFIKSAWIPSLLASSWLLVGIASAQAQPMPMEHGPMHQRMDPAKMEAMVSKRLADLKTRLKITPAQEGSWNSFAATMKPPANAMERPDHAEMDKLTTPERIDRMQALHKQKMSEHQVAMDKRADATKALYANLNDDQKKVMDTEQSRMRKGMERMRKHREATPAPAASGAHH